MSDFTRLKRVALMRAGGTPPVDDLEMWSEDGTPWVAIGDMTASKVVRTTQRSVSPAGIRAKRLPVGHPGTLLFAMYASVGTIAVLGTEATWNQAILGIDPHPGLCEARFLRYWLEHLKRDLSALVRSNTQDNLNAEQVGEFPFPIISMAQQRVVADYLDAETSRLDILIGNTSGSPTGTLGRLIMLLKERRQALITAAVTGELDIPGAPA